MRESADRDRKILRPLLIVLIVLAAVGCDQAAKGIARARLADKGTVPVLGTVVVLRYVENEGAFMSLGVRLPRPLRTLVFIAFPLAALALMTAYLLRARDQKWMALAALALILGGGIGNLIDRLFRDGRVSDFLNLGIGNLRTGIFNAADIFILAGCVLLLASPGLFRTRSRPQP
jgi:signal peptidase II